MHRLITIIHTYYVKASVNYETLKVTACDQSGVISRVSKPVTY